MNKLLAFFFLAFLGCSILSGTLEGGGMPAATTLAANMSENVTSCSCNSTAGFLGSNDWFVIGQEECFYTSTNATAFIGLTRGYNGTEISTHSTGAMIYSSPASVVNFALGFNIGQTVDAMGFWSVVTIPYFFLSETLPQLVMWNFSFLKGDLAFLGIFFMAIGAAFVVTLALMLAGVRRV